MKKVLSIIFVALLSTATFAQEAATTTGVVNKKGEAILPVAGDISVGTSALPFLDYAGNMLSIAGSAGLLDLTAAPTATIYGRYYLADDAAIRVDISVTNNTNTTKTLTPDLVALAADPLSKATVEDKNVVKNRAFSISAGYQKSRGYGRLRGNYGGIINYTYAKAGITTNEYGNKTTATNPGPFTLSSKPSATSTFSVGPVLGVEYYIAPKICVGAEINLLWGVTVGNNYTETETESWDAVTSAVKTVTTKEDESARVKTANEFFGTSGFGSSAGIYVMFTF